MNIYLLKKRIILHVLLYFFKYNLYIVNMCIFLRSVSFIVCSLWTSLLIFSNEVNLEVIRISLDRWSFDLEPNQILTSKNGKINIDDIKDFAEKAKFKKPEIEYKNKFTIKEVDYSLVVLRFFDRKSDEKENIAFKNVNEIDIPEYINNNWEVHISLFTTKAVNNIKNSFITKIKAYEKEYDLKNKISLYDYCTEYISSGRLVELIHNVVENNPDQKIEIPAEYYGSAVKIPLCDYFNQAYIQNPNSCYLCNGNDHYDFRKSSCKDITFDIEQPLIKRKINVVFYIPDGYVLALPIPNKFTLDLKLDKFTTLGILNSLSRALWLYFDDIYDKSHNDNILYFCCIGEVPFFKFNYDIYKDGPLIDPKYYKFTNIHDESLIIKNDEGINNNDIFNLTDDSTIEIKVGEYFDYLKTNILPIKFHFPADTELNDNLKNKKHILLLNYNSDSLEQVRDYLRTYDINNIKNSRNYNYIDILIDTKSDDQKILITFTKNEIGHFLKSKKTLDLKLDENRINSTKLNNSKFTLPLPNSKTNKILMVNESPCCSACCYK